MAEHLKALLKSKWLITITNGANFYGDYPNKESWRKHKDAKQKGLISQSATIGGEVGIHGTPKSEDYLIDDGINWTAGCISLKHKDVEEIYKIIKLG